jgi:alpha-beta hydrolase superfamily lysophospholipase
MTPTSHFVRLTDRPVVQSNGDVCSSSLTLHYWQWSGHKPTVLVCHAASLHARCYDHIIDAALSGRHVIALDLRGHGRSQQHPAPYRFRWFGEDVLQFIEHLHLSDTSLIGIGHSLGGYALTWASAAATNRLFQSLLLIDPGIVPRSLYGLYNEKTSAFDYVLRRKSRWTSTDDMMSYVKTRMPFSRWPHDVLHAFCRPAFSRFPYTLCDRRCQ